MTARLADDPGSTPGAASIPASSNGRTPHFDCGNGGSTPSAGTNYSGSASAQARVPSTFARQSPPDARSARIRASTTRSRSIPGGGNSGMVGSAWHVSRDGGGLTATASTLGPQDAKPIPQRIVRIASSGPRPFVARIDITFRLFCRFRRNDVRALVGFPNCLACGFHLPHKIAPLVPVSIYR